MGSEISPPGTGGIKYNSLHASENEGKANMLNRFERTKLTRYLNQIQKAEYVYEKQYRHDTRTMRCKSARYARRASLCPATVHRVPSSTETNVHESPSAASYKRHKLKRRPISAPVLRNQDTTQIYAKESLGLLPHGNGNDVSSEWTNRPATSRSVISMVSSPYKLFTTEAFIAELENVSINGSDNEDTFQTSQIRKCNDNVNVETIQTRKPDDGLVKKSETQKKENIMTKGTSPIRQDVARVSTSAYNHQENSSLETYDVTSLQQTNDTNSKGRGKKTDSCAGAAAGSHYSRPSTRPKSVTYFICDRNINNRIRNFLDSQVEFNNNNPIPHEIKLNTETIQSLASMRSTKECKQSKSKLRAELETVLGIL